MPPGAIKRGARSIASGALNYAQNLIRCAAPLTARVRVRVRVRRQRSMRVTSSRTRACGIVLCRPSFHIHTHTCASTPFLK